MPEIRIQASVKVETKEERPTSFVLCENAATTESPTGEKLTIIRSVTNPFYFEIRGERNNAEIDLAPFFQEALLHVLRENDYSAPERNDRDISMYPRDSFDD